MAAGGGSEEHMKYKEAQDWIKELNRKEYAGYYDCRLPTLEEAMSLMEPEKNEGGLYIDPVFDSRQRYFWTCDTLKGESRLRLWALNFITGYCYWHDPRINLSYVRAVRFV